MKFRSKQELVADIEREHRPLADLLASVPERGAASWVSGATTGRCTIWSRT